MAAEVAQRGEEEKGASSRANDTAGFRRARLSMWESEICLLQGWAVLLSDDLGTG